jgi:hypothetical protein
LDIINIEMYLNGAWFQASAAKQIRTPLRPILTSEEGTDRLSRNVGKKLPPLAA